MMLQEIKDYLRIDYDYEDDYLQELIDVSLLYIDSMVSENYKVDQNAIKLANLVQKKLINDMHSNRSTEVSKDVKQDRIVTGILDKLSNYDEVVV